MGVTWQRDTTGQNKTNSSAPPAAMQQPIKSGKRKLVWTRDQQEQPAPAGTNQRAASNGHSFSNPCDQYDHFEKRARFNQEANHGYSGQHQQASHQQRPIGAQAAHSSQANGSQQPTTARQDPAAVLAQRQKAAELAELKRRIQQREAEADRQKKEKAAAAAQAAQEAVHERSKRKAKLEAGFSEAFKKAKEAAAAESATGKAPLKLASEEEVHRVLAAKTDHECLQIPVGTDASTIKRKYRELAVSLHPDKCKAEGATDAFQRLVKAYQTLLRLAKQS